MAFYHSNKMPWARPKDFNKIEKTSIIKLKKHDK